MYVGSNESALAFRQASTSFEVICSMNLGMLSCSLPWLSIRQSIDLAAFAGESQG
jgi:hypothetical protein